VFAFGRIIALVGGVARKKLRKSPEFADARRFVRNAIEEAGKDPEKIMKARNFEKKRANPKTTLYYFLMQCYFPVGFYYVYMHLGGVLKESFNLSAAEIIKHNFIISIFRLLGTSIATYLSYYFHPLKILKIQFIASGVMILAYTSGLIQCSSQYEMLVVQTLLIVLWPGECPAGPIFYKHFPVFQRFRCVSMTFALSRASTYVITSFGFAYLVHKFGNFGVLIGAGPVYISYIIGLLHFRGLEIASGDYKSSFSVPKISA
jgi:hypothetical protein